MNTVTSADKNRQLAKIVARAWMDPAYKSRLLAGPEALFRAEGIEIPEDVKVNVVVDTPEHLNLVLSERARPQRPAKTADGGDDFYALLTAACNRALEDVRFKERLLADPTDTLRQLGATIPAGTTISVHHESAGERFFALPLPPKARIKVETMELLSSPMHIDEGGPAPAAMLLKRKPDNHPTNVTIHVNANVNVNGDVNVNGAVNVNVAAAAAATAAVVAIAAVCIKTI